MNLAFGVILVATAMAATNPADRGLTEYPDGPLRAIYRVLNVEQKRRFDLLVQTGDTLKKADRNERLVDFVRRLGVEQRKEIDEYNRQFEEKQTREARMVLGLSDGAQKLYDSLMAVVNDESITPMDERQQIADIHRRADSALVAELREAGVHLPGLPEAIETPKPTAVADADGRRRRSQFFPPPFAAIAANLSDAERDQLHRVLNEGQKKTRRDARLLLDEFVESLSPELQDKVTEQKQKRDQLLDQHAARVQLMSDDAQHLYRRLIHITKDPDITMAEEHRRLRDTLKEARREVINEFHKNHIPLPGFPFTLLGRGFITVFAQRRRGPGGLMGSIWGRLSKSQRVELNKIYAKTDMKKREFRKKIKDFVGTLPSDLQEKFKKVRELRQAELKKNLELIKTMSSDVQKFYTDLLAISKDGSITFAEERRKVRKLMKATETATLQELRKSDIRLPSFLPKPPLSDDGDNSDSDEKKKTKKKKVSDEESEEELKPKRYGVWARRQRRHWRG